MKEDAPSGFVDACSTADRAGTCLAIIKNLVAAFLRELSLECRIEVLLRIILPHLAKSAAMRAPAVRRIKGEKPRIQRLEGAATLRTIHFRADDVELPFAVPNASRALANFKRSTDEFPRIAAREDFADQCIDRVFLKPLEPRKAGDRRDRAVHKKKIDTIARRPLGNSCMEALACFDQRGKDLNRAAAGESLNGSGNGGKRLLFDGDTAVGTMLRAEF